MSPRRELEVHVPVTRGRGAPPVSEQVHRGLLDAMAAGRLAPGSRLPASRVLAASLGVSRGTVVAAYARLADEGHVSPRQGAATVVVAAPPSPAAAAEQPAGLPSVPVHDLRPGAPDLRAFPRGPWGAATTQALRTMPDSALGYVTPWGDAMLRAELAVHLAASRRVTATAEDVVVTSGTTQALTLSCRVLVAAGHTTLAVEDPSNAIQRQVLGRYGLHVLDVPVDDHGLDVAALAATGTRAVLVTPAHQYPRGVTMSPARRQALLAWARRVDGVVLEDDYDAEFSFGTVAPASLRAGSPDHVWHTGSVSKTLAPALRIGWLVAPRRVQADLRGAKRDDDFGGDALAQRTLAHMLADGSYARHLRRARRLYRQRREAMVAAVQRHLPGWQVRGADAGLHLALDAPDGTDEAAVVDAAAARAVLVLGMDSMRRLPGAPGLAVGYGRVRQDQAEDAVLRLAAAARDAARGRRRRGARTAGPLPEAALAARLGTSAVDYFPRGLRPGAEPALVPPPGWSPSPAARRRAASAEELS